MAFVETFALSTAVATTTQSRTGYGFQPVAAMFIYADQGTGSSMRISRGFALSPSDRIVVDWQQIDNSSDNMIYGLDSYRATNAVVKTHDYSTGSVDGAWDLDSFDADGMTLIVDVQDASADNVTVIAWSADEILDAEIKDWTTGSGTGDTDITGTSISFPNLAFHFGLKFFGASTKTGLSNAVTAISGYTEFPSASATADGYCNGTECNASISTSGAVSERGRVTSWLSNGFTHTVDEGGSGIAVYSVMLRVSDAAIGTLQTQTSIVSFSASARVRIQSLVFCSGCTSEDTLDVSHADARITMGVCDSAYNQGRVSMWIEDAVSPTDVLSFGGSDSVYVSQDVSTGATDGKFSVTSFSSSNLTLSMDDAESGQAFVWFVAIGSPIPKGAAPIFF